MGARDSRLRGLVTSGRRRKAPIASRGALGVPPSSSDVAPCPHEALVTYLSGRRICLDCLASMRPHDLGSQGILEGLDPRKPVGQDAPPRARRSDPISSHAAADHAESTGLIASQQQKALAMVASYPGRTARELSRLRWPDDELKAERLFRALGRRLPELVALGRLRRDDGDVEGVRWWPRGHEEVVRPDSLN